MGEKSKGPSQKRKSRAQSPKGTNYLLAIAINDYLHYSKLNNPISDTEALIELLTTRYQFDPDQVTFIKNAEATKTRIESAFDELIDLIELQDNLIVYFSGHGRYNKKRGGFWIPVDAGNGDKAWTEYLSNDTIKSYLNKIENFHTFLIVDSCFSGSLFMDKSKEKSGDRRDTDPSRWGLTSGKNEIVSDGEPGQNSPFAAALLDVLLKADQPPSVMHICDLVLEKVAANKNQTPMGSVLKVEGHQGGQMVFYFREDEEQAWTAAQSTNTANAYEGFLGKYPHGKYSVLAVEKLEELEKKEKERWEKIPKDNKISLFRYITENPQSPYLKEAQRLVDALREKPVVEKREEQLVLKPPIIAPKLIVPDHMVLVKGGTFQMGEDKEVREVTLSDFLIAKHPLTFEEYDAFCEATGRELPSDEGWGRGQRPVIYVDWFDTIYYCNWRSQQEGLAKVYKIKQQQVSSNWQANGYRLPTEAEWEYAARGGQKSQGFEYAGSNNADEVAWYGSNSGGKTLPVGKKEANELGLYDLSGNVWEWCWDWIAYPSSGSNDPKGPDSGSRRVNRGGSWCNDPILARVALRGADLPADCNVLMGFRLARAAVAL
ncbi:MAG: SUMF1/EgtB/PvdO family nonheme iron enzyme [Haliscomenobacter sp.]|uniref:SUMF1/EgtB/PvdO family nonheme iron enzyme n=1 Tax=Haliscomenobacter sp. TaxID=2717303 RepID=UPI0029BAA677|nr:SUMF1/EgtB/PvdO family nonheme iron enzyme [Haliscomenobacter sp.]MDX2072559.1 SUMF1/EgtB/PvdO family nonheme iron enzyme [Haliscomenobacter sp.]